MEVQTISVVGNCAGTGDDDDDQDRTDHHVFLTALMERSMNFALSSMTVSFRPDFPVDAITSAARAPDLDRVRPRLLLTCMRTPRVR